MKPAPFEYHATASVQETVALLAELRDDDAKLLAGGQSLLPMLNLRLARPKHLVDVNGLADLDFIRETPDGGLVIGALTRHRAIERSSPVAARAPLWAEAIPHVGDRQVRFRGTVGGSIAHADPSSELPTVALAVGAEMKAVGPSGERLIPAEEFFVSVLTTALEPDEMLTEIRLPAPNPRAGHAFMEFVRRHGDYAIVSAAASVVLDDGHIKEARLCLGGVDAVPVRARTAEDMLIGKQPGPEVFAEAGRLAAADIDPPGDVHGSSEYRREVAAVYVERVLELAIRRAGEARAGGTE